MGTLLVYLVRYSTDSYQDAPQDQFLRKDRAIFIYNK